MGGGQSTIVNVEDSGLNINAGRIYIKNECKYIKCSPNISQFSNYNNINNNINDINNYIIIYLLFLIFIYIFIWFIIIKKMI